MSVTDQGFALVDLASVPAAILDSFSGCPLVQRAGGWTVFQRRIQFRITWTADDDWFYELVGADPGNGVVRYRGIDFTPLLRRALDRVWLDLSTDWLIDVTQTRSVVSGSGRRHRPRPARLFAAGPEVGVIAMLGRHGVRGGEVRLSHRDDQVPVWEGVVSPGQALLVDGNRIVADIYPVRADAGGEGCQDVFTMAMSRLALSTSVSVVPVEGR